MFSDDPRLEAMSKSITSYLSHNLDKLGPSEPVVVFLHGYGADEADLPEIISHLPNQAWVSPRAPLSNGGGGFEWYQLTMENYTPAPEIAVATEKLWNWIDQVIPAQNPIIPIGFSQGALMATQLLRTRPQRISRAIIMAGFINPIELEADVDCQRLKPKVLYCRGEEDNRISEAAVTRITSWLQAHTSLQMKSYPGLGHSVDQRVINDVSNFLLAK